MFHKKINPIIIAIICYICLFMIVIPCRIEGALLVPKNNTKFSHNSVIIARLVGLGMSWKEAKREISFLNRFKIISNKNLIFAGGKPPMDYDPPINNIGLVFLIMGIAVGIGIYAGSQTGK